MLSLKSPWNREAESVHSAVTGIFSSPGSPTAQAAHSSHCWPHACSWHPILSFQLLSLPELLPQSHPAPHTSALAVLSRGGGQILPQQQGTKHSYQQLQHWSRYPWMCMEHPSGHTDLLTPTKPSLRHCFAAFCSLEGCNSSGGCNLSCFTLSRGSASQSSVMAER